MNQILVDITDLETVVSTFNSSNCERSNLDAGLKERYVISLYDRGFAR